MTSDAQVKLLLLFLETMGIYSLYFIVDFLPCLVNCFFELSQTSIKLETTAVYSVHILLSNCFVLSVTLESNRANIDVQKLYISWEL